MADAFMITESSWLYPVYDAMATMALIPNGGGAMGGATANDLIIISFSETEKLAKVVSQSCNSQFYATHTLIPKNYMYTTVYIRNKLLIINLQKIIITLYECIYRNPPKTRPLYCHAPSPAGNSLNLRYSMERVVTRGF